MSALRRLTAILDWRQQAKIFEQFAVPFPICPQESIGEATGVRRDTAGNSPRISPRGKLPDV